MYQPDRELLYIYISFELLCSLTDLIAAWAASSLTPPSAQRTCLCLTERRETPAITPTAGLWRGWAPVRRSTSMSCCHTLRTSPSTSQPSQTACLTRSALSEGSRPRSPSANCALTNTATRLVQSVCYFCVLIQFVTQAKYSPKLRGSFRSFAFNLFGFTLAQAIRRRLNGGSCHNTAHVHLSYHGYASVIYPHLTELLSLLQNGQQIENKRKRRAKLDRKSMWNISLSNKSWKT